MKRLCFYMAVSSLILSMFVNIATVSVVNDNMDWVEKRLAREREMRELYVKSIHALAGIQKDTLDLLLYDQSN